MGEIRRAVLGFVAIAALSAIFSTPTGIASQNPTVDEYWMVYQPSTPWPTPPHVWLFAPQGPANVTLRGHDGAETTILVAGCNFTKFPLADLGHSYLDWGMQYVQVRSDRELWIVGEHRKPNGDYVADPGTARPHRKFVRRLLMGAAWDKTSINDCLIVVNAPTPATITFKAWAGPYDGYDAEAARFDAPVERTATRTVHGVATFEPYYLLGLNSAWVLEMTSDTPVAMQVMDAGGFWRWDILGNGYMDDWTRISGIETPGTEYIFDRDVTWAGARFPEGGGTLSVYGPDGALRFFDHVNTNRGRVWGTSAGTSVDSPVFPTGPQRWVGSVPFAPDIDAPKRSEQTLDSATFMGYRGDNSRLHIFNDAATPVTITVADALRPDRVSTYVVPAWSASVRHVNTLGIGLPDTAPYLLAVRANRSVFMSVEIDRMGGYLRPYPYALFQICPSAAASAPSAAIPCLVIKVPPAGRKRVSGTCLAVMADVCHETGSPVAARRAVETVRFEVRIGTGAWTLIPSADANFPNADSTHPWLIHWDVTALPETVVAIRAVGSDSTGATRASEPIEVVIDHANWEIRSRCGTTRGAGEARAPRGAAVEMTAGGVEVRGETATARTVRVVAGSDALPADDVLHAEVVAGEAVTAPLPLGWVGIGEFREVNLLSGTSQLSGAVDLYLSYEDLDGDGRVDGSGIPAEALRGFSKTDTGEWTPVDTVGVDTGAREVHLRTTHFTLFALAAPASLSVGGGGDGGMCVLTRSGSPFTTLEFLRGIRDLLLATPVLRLLASLYY